MSLTREAGPARLAGPTYGTDSQLERLRAATAISRSLSDCKSQNPETLGDARGLEIPAFQTEEQSRATDTERYRSRSSCLN